MLNIIEIFNSIQGEGSHIGEPSTFIRTAGCNLAGKCIGCDSPYSFGIGKKMTIDEIIQEVEKYPTKNIVLTGGEPTMQEHAADLCYALHRRSFIISVQTNGTQWTQLLDICNHILMDMKPKFSDLSFINLLAPQRDEVKVLVGDESDLEFAHEINQRASENSVLTIVQVKNDFRNDRLEDLIAKYDWLSKQTFLDPVRILPQLHVLIWGNERGI